MTGAALADVNAVFSVGRFNVAASCHLEIVAGNAVAVIYHADSGIHNLVGVVGGSGACKVGKGHEHRSGEKRFLHGVPPMIFSNGISWRIRQAMAKQTCSAVCLLRI